VHPGGFVPAAGLVEVGEFADVVDLKARRGLAELAAPGHELVDQLVAPGAGHPVSRTPVVFLRAGRWAQVPDSAALSR
jgi:hypothetical protein